MIDYNALTLINYCHPDLEPMQNIMRLPKAQAFCLAKKLAESHPDTTAFYRFADFENYYALREKQDAYLHAQFTALGGEPEEEHPLSFVVEGSAYLKAWFGNGIETKLPLCKIDPKHLSFTVGDSGANYEKNGGIELLTADAFQKRIAPFESFDAFIKSTGRNYIEAQLWSDRYIKIFST